MISGGFGSSDRVQRSTSLGEPRPAPKQPPQPLDAAIAAVLQSDDAAVDDLAKLISRVEVALEDTDAALDAEKARALDPLNLEAAKSRALVGQLELERDRLDVALPALKAKLRDKRRQRSGAGTRSSVHRLSRGRAGLVTWFRAHKSLP